MTIEKAHNEIDIEFRHLMFSIDSKKKSQVRDIESQSLLPKSASVMVEKKIILNNVSGKFKSGRMTAILGPSGSGKSSLLNALIGELDPAGGKSEFSGSILLNNQLANPSTLRQMTSYVYQDDVILETMTVREAIEMSALLRLPKGSRIGDMVDDMIAVLDLDNCRDTVIGNSLKKGISGGERKRVAVAMELITNPSVLFLDEPTSGLDAASAFKLVQSLSKIAESGRTVVASIHQPSAELFGLFDDALILVDGSLIYCGQVEEIVNYFGSLNYKCPTYSNPADYLFLRVLTDNYKGYCEADEFQESVQERRQKLISNWELINPTPPAYSSSNQTITATFTQMKYKSDFWTQFNYLLGRSFKNFLRNPMLFKVKMFQVIFVSLLVGAIYSNINERPPDQQVTDRGGALFFFPTNLIMMYAFGILNVFALEKMSFYREFRNGYYSLPAYFLSKTLVEFPFQILFPLLQALGVYFWIFGVHFDKFLVFSAFTVLLANCGQSLGVVFACAFDDVQIALAITPVIMLPLMIFGGFFVSSDTIPSYLIWIKWLSPIHYGFAGLAKNGMFSVLYLISLEFKNWTPIVKEGEYSRFKNGQDALKALALEDGMGYETDLVILLSIFLGLMILSYGLLYNGTRRRDIQQ